MATKRPNQRVNPKSLKNLNPITNSETAREMQKKAVESRLQRKKLLQEFKAIAADVKEEVGALAVLRVLMSKAIEDGDFDTAGHYATTLASYEAPKLQAVSQTNIETNLTELSDEELEAQANSMGIDVKALLKKSTDDAK